MALGNREQVGSSFKPYVLSAARAQGMSVKTSTLDGSSPLCVPGDRYPLQYSVPSPSGQAGCPTTPYGWHAFTNDAGDSGTGGPQSVVYATAASLNTAYTDLAHRVGLQNIADMAKSLGVNTAQYPGGSGLQEQASQGQVGIALGTASLTVGEQANTFATLAANGQYVTPHVIAQITQGTNLIRAQVVHRAALTPAEASDVDYALSFDTYTGYGTGGAAGMSDGRPIIGKTGTTSSEQSAFFLGAIPQYSLAIGMFTNQQNGVTGGETLNDVGGLPGYGGDWPARIWHSFAEKEFAKLPIQQFPTPDYGGSPWNLTGSAIQTKPAKPRTTPSPHPTPTPTGTCTPTPLHPTCGSPPPTSPPTSPPPTSPPTTCTPGFHCHTRSPAPLPFNNDGGNNGNRASASLAADPSPSPRPARSG
jgi:membrane peptidoglycan carboxypeptidase